MVIYGSLRQLIVTILKPIFLMIYWFVQMYRELEFIRQCGPYTLADCLFRFILLTDVKPELNVSSPGVLPLGSGCYLLSGKAHKSVWGRYPHYIHTGLCISSQCRTLVVVTIYHPSERQNSFFPQKYP